MATTPGRYRWRPEADGRFAPGLQGADEAAHGVLGSRCFDYDAEMDILMEDIDLAIALDEDLGVQTWVCQAAWLVFNQAMFRGQRGRI
jgi:hypothetical protein